MHMDEINRAEQAMTRHLHMVLDESTYQRLRKAAFDQQRSLGEIVRLAIMAYLPAEPHAATQ